MVAGVGRRGLIAQAASKKTTSTAGKIEVGVGTISAAGDALVIATGKREGMVIQEVTEIMEGVVQLILAIDLMRYLKG
ncbi:hypothetical protein C0J52_01136 [Blattella germanica]|nr:hypothetical protein C0J52_01136 [Blattella germanica]